MFSLLRKICLKIIPNFTTNDFDDLYLLISELYEFT